MAKKKGRTPDPPKKIQAPKERRGKDPRQERSKAPAGAAPTGWWRSSRYVAVGLGALAGVAILVVVLATVLGGKADATAITAAGCVQETFPAQGRQHVTELEEGFEYNSVPATSGQHHPQPGIWNIYDRPVDEIYMVHNLEHGGIAVQYGDEVSEADVAAIRAWYEESDRTGIVVAPHPALGDQVAMTAWTKLATCASFDPAAADAFVDLHRYNGPERLPVSAMQPGS